MRRRAVLRIGSLAVLAALVALCAIALRPAALGGPVAIVIVSGQSMEPGFQSGDLVLALRQRSYERGDVVVYRVPAGEPGDGSIVIHRVVGGSGSAGYRVRGDNKNGLDPWTPTDDDVLGTARLTVPRAGSALVALRSPLGLAAVAGLVTFLIAIGSGAGAREPRRASRSRSQSS